jgi:hypothetical protein
MTFDARYLIDGNLTVSVTLTNGAGNSGATTTSAIKDTIPPAISVSAPPFINNSNAANFQVIVSGEPGANVGYVITDGKNTISNSKGGAIPASGKWNANINLAKFNNGPVTLTVTETDPAGNPTVSTTSLYKMVQTVAAPTVALSSSSDSGASNSDYVTNVTNPAFVTSSAAGTTVAIYVGGVLYTGQTLAQGSYAVTAVASDAYGNSSPTATAPKTLVVNTSPPSGSWTVSGGKVIGGQLWINTRTPTLALTFTDVGGLSTMAWAQGAGAYSSPVAYASSLPISLPSDGSFVVAVRLVDLAGNVGVYTQSVSVDTLGPAIAYTISPPQSTTIGYDGSAAISISASGTDSGSGVSSVKIVLDSALTVTSGAIDVTTLMAGSHTIVITAVDLVGNTTTQTLTFNLHPSRQAIAAAVNGAVPKSLITSSEASKLLSILNNASASLSTDLNNFITEVRNQSGKAISAGEASILQSWATDDLTTLW